MSAPAPELPTNPWQALRAALRTLWQLALSGPQGKRVVRRFVGLYAAVVLVLVLLGHAFLLIFLGLLRAAFLAAPLYPRVARGLRLIGWEGADAVPEVPSRWRALHTGLWVVLIGLAVTVGVYVLFTRGFCGQNWLCLLLGAG